MQGPRGGILGGGSLRPSSRATNMVFQVCPLSLILANILINNLR